MKIGNWRVPGTYLTHLYQWVRLHRRAIPWSWHTGRPRRQLEEFWRTPPKGGALRVDFWWFWASHPPEVLKKYVTITSRYLWVDRRAIKLANFSLLCMIQPFNFGFWRPKFMKRWISPGFLCWGVFAKVQGKTKRCPTTWLGLKQLIPEHETELSWPKWPKHLRHVCSENQIPLFYLFGIFKGLQTTGQPPRFLIMWRS
jgi:hypothetical protein